MTRLFSAAVLFCAMSAGAVENSPASSPFSNNDGMLFRLVPVEIGACPDVPDVSGNSHYALSQGNVTCGKASNGKHLAGFTTATSFAVVTNASATWDGDWTAIAWVRNPDFSLSNALLLMRAAGKNDSNLDSGGGNVPWQIWLTSDKRVGIGLQDWNGGTTNNLAESVRGPVLEWKTNAWYQVAAICAYTRTGNVRTRNIKVYVTEAGADIGDCVAELEQSSASGFATSTRNFLLGAGRKGYYGNAAPGGCFGGDIGEATLFMRRLAKSELAEDVDSFSHFYFETEDFATLYWKLDESGVLPTAVDATTNGYNGITRGSVFGGASCPQGSSYSGFADDGDQLCTQLSGGTWWANTYRSEVLLWVRRPKPTCDSTALLAGAMYNCADPGSSQPWRVAVEENGAVSVSMQTWKGSREKSTGEPYDWGSGWHLVSIRFDRPDLPVDASTFACNRIRVYVASASSQGEPEFKMVVSAQHQFNNDLMASGSYLVFGSAGAGYYDEFKPKSVLGAGARLGEIAVSYGGYFEWDYLLSRLVRYNPKNGLVIVFR